ncbi:MAG: xylan 1,4-beta-xylosidase [Oscillospiraceae bacterium]|jgi:xylan 1,4-beta-xylosidase|nr:xylan 1,4-beta-xylosidase [Oscillospiraceae bacterium]
MKKQYTANQSVTFNNNATFCVGTGRLGLGLQKEYIDQLRLVQSEIGFKHMRGHGLFNEDLAIYQERRGFDGVLQAVEYNFTYLDLLFDSWLELGIKPFIELGFMPHAIASGTQDVFYWKGNVTPPRDYADWAALVQATLRHLLIRYGDTAATFPVEVWNEPNLGGFWKDADRAEYFKLYDVTARAVKEVDARFRIGGPAICGVDDTTWMRDFLDYVRDNAVPLDFITRHLYDISLPVTDGRYGYPTLTPLRLATGETERTRAIIDDYDEFRGMEIHVTEFNTSYSPRTPLHDTNINAAYICYLLSKLGDDCASYSYWTFGDIFEEQGVPFTPFHGGFGLVANGGIPKPTFYAFKFFSDLGDGDCVLRTDDCIVLKTDGGYRGVAWNISPASERDDLEITVALPDAAERVLVTRTVDETTCNPLKLWHDIGEPQYPSKSQTELLRASAKPLIASQPVTGAEFTLTLNPNAIVYFELSPVVSETDWGFDYERSVAVEYTVFTDR